MFLKYKTKTIDSKRKTTFDQLRTEFTFILACVEQINFLPKLHYGSATVLIVLRILKTNILCMDMDTQTIKYVIIKKYWRRRGGTMVLLKWKNTEKRI